MNQCESSAATTTVHPTIEETTSVSCAALPSVSEQNTATSPLQPVPCVKKALRASKFNRLDEQAQLSKEITLVVGAKVICSLDLLLQLFAEKCRHPGCQLTTTVNHTLNGTAALIKWKSPAAHVGKFWTSHKVNGVLANNL